MLPTLAAPRPLSRPPAEFDGGFQELFDRYVEPNLPSVSAVHQLHRRLVQHCDRTDSLCIVRYVKGLDRRAVHETASGQRFRVSDNAPAWWMHFLAFNELTDVDLAQMPTHMFDVRFSPNINSAGWHVAHILNAKDGNVDWRNWSRAELTRRFIRNVHPCNCFYVPKAGWHRYGGDPGVIAFFANVYAERYGAVWEEFLQFAGGVQPPPHPVPRYVYGGQPRHATTEPQVANAAWYRFTRLAFKAAVIEPLAMDDSFEVVTPAGTYRMTKAQFYRDFANVTQSKSYRVGGVYSYASVPQRALRYWFANER